MGEPPPPKCPKCRKTVMGIGRSGASARLSAVTVHHFDGMVPCKIKMTWSDSQALADLVSGDLGNRK